jgi:hypothetical protein
MEGNHMTTATKTRLLDQLLLMNYPNTKQVVIRRGGTGRVIYSGNIGKIQYGLLIKTVQDTYIEGDNRCYLI